MKVLYVPPSLEELYKDLHDIDQSNIVLKYKSIVNHFRSYAVYTDTDEKGFVFIHTVSELFFDDYDDKKGRGTKHSKEGLPSKEDLKWLEKKYENHRQYLIEHNRKIDKK